MPIYMSLAGIEGESQSPGFPGFFDVFVTSWGVEREVSGSKGGGGGSATPDLSDISITKPAAKGSPKLFLACCSGQRFSDAEIIYTDVSSGAETKYFHVKLTEVRLAGWINSGDGGGVPTESLTLNYAKIAWEYTAKDGSKESVFWDKGSNSGG